MSDTGEKRKGSRKDGKGSEKGSRKGGKKEAVEPEVEQKKKSIDPNTIRNKQKREEVYQKLKDEKAKLKSVDKKKKKREREELGDKAPPKKIAKTQDNTKEADETVVDAEDEEVQGDEAIDEFSKYFTGDVKPKIVITSCYHPTKMMYDFIRDLLHVFPNSFYYERKRFTIKEIVETTKAAGYTDVIIINEDKKKFNGLTLIHLPEGPTAHFKLSSVIASKDIANHGRTQEAKPEVILNNFTTRLGHRVGRMLGALFHQEPFFKGRRVATFHNQRDFIFFRHHRYIFSEAGKKVNLQELGPQFSLKLRWLQHGTFDTKQGEFEWVHKTEMDTSRKRFFL